MTQQCIIHRSHQANFYEMPSNCTVKANHGVANGILRTHLIEQHVSTVLLIHRALHVLALRRIPLLDEVHATIRLRPNILHRSPCTMVRKQLHKPLEYQIAFKPNTATKEYLRPIDYQPVFTTARHQPAFKPGENTAGSRL